MNDTLNRRLAHFAAAALFSYPLALIAAFYVPWLVAFAVLGHKPAPSIDDPTSISVWVNVAYYGSGLLVVGFPAAALGGIALAVGLGFSRRLSAPKSSLLSLGLIAAWTVAFALLRWDPLRVVDWYMD